MNKNCLDHPPTPEELAAIYMQSEENDPQSLYYKRDLVRPKPPIITLVFIFLLILVLGVAAFIGVKHLLYSTLLAVIGSILTMLIIGLLLAKPIVIALVKMYQALASEKVLERCRFEPSCSVYMLLAIEKYGFWKGFIKGLKRWGRCKPPNGGFDPP